MAKENGYIRGIDEAALLRVAREHDLVVYVEHGVGDFVVQNAPLCTASRDLVNDQDAAASLQRAFVISRNRTVDQDPAFGIRQIVDIAVKALSPGVNDTTTAVTCVDYLTAVLSRIVVRRNPSRLCYETGELRVVMNSPTFEGLLTLSFDEIRASSSGNAVVMMRMLDALETILDMTSAAAAAAAARRRAIGEQRDRIAELADRTVTATHDRARLEARLARLRSTIRDIAEDDAG